MAVGPQRCPLPVVRCPWVVLLAAALGCRAAPQVTGTYDLVGVNGRRLPVQAGHISQGTSELVGGSLTLNPDGSYSYRLRFHVQQLDRDYADSALQGGTYTRRMSTVTFQAPGGNMSGQLAGSTLALTMGGWTYLFRKPALDGDPPADTNCVADRLGLPCRPSP